MVTLGKQESHLDFLFRVGRVQTLTIMDCVSMIDDSMNEGRKKDKQEPT